MKYIQLFVLLFACKVVLAQSPTSRYINIPRSTALALEGRQMAGNMNIFSYTRRVVSDSSGTDTLYYCSPQFLTIFKPAFDSLAATGWDGWDDTFYYGIGDFYTYCGGCGRP